MAELSEKISFTLDDEVGVKGMEVPDVIQVLPAGDVSPKGKTGFVVDGDARKSILDAFGKSQTDLVIDYEHQSLSGSEAPAAGWVKELTDRGGEGIWAKVQWTERAKEYLANREYRYLSPVVLIRKKDGRAVELLGAALTNLPAIDGMAPVVNRAAITDGEEVTRLEEEYREKYLAVLKMFGLPDDAEAGDVQAKIEAMSMPDGYVPEEQYNAVVEAMKAKDADALVREGIAGGKISPSLAEWARGYAISDPDGFREFMGRALPVVPLGARHADFTHAIDAPQREVNRLLGIKDESFIRHCPAAS